MSRLAARAPRFSKPAPAPCFEVKGLLVRPVGFGCIVLFHSGAPVSASDKPYTVACQAGRLVELRIGIFTAREQFVQAQAEVGDILARIREPILCVDVRGGRLMPEHLADAGLGAMRNDNPLFFRCALLVTSPMLGLQLTRLSREANNVRRKIFDTPGHLELWLRPHLTDPEFVRLEAFLSERPSLSAMPVAGERPANPSGH